MDSRPLVVGTYMLAVSAVVARSYDQFEVSSGVSDNFVSDAMEVMD